LKYGVDFTVEPIPKRHGHKVRVKPFHTRESVMDTVRQAKNPEPTQEILILRKYWRIHKAKERAEKAKK
jgi:hypothetical protein